MEEFYLEQLRSLNKNKLFQSAKFLGSFIPSSCLTVEILVELAEAHFGVKDFDNAVTLFKNLLQKKPSPALEIELKKKLADCYFKLNNLKAALPILASIPEPNRDIQVNLKLAKIYHQPESTSKQAVLCYKEVLKKCPMAIEAVSALVELGVEPMELQNFYSKFLPQHTAWLFNFLEGLSFSTKNQPNRSVAIFSQLEQKFPDNIQLLIHMALSHYKSGSYDAAKKIFHKIRALDPKCIDSMDLYAFILKRSGDILEVNRLTYDLLSSNPKRAECWTTVAIYYELKSKKEIALSHVDRAIALNPRHTWAYLIKGSLHRSLEQFDRAIASFQKAKSLSRDMIAYQGLVESYLRTEDVSRALLTAQEAYRLMPNNPKSTCLLAYVYTTDPQHVDKAKKLFDQALAMDPSCLDAVVGLANLYKEKNKLQEAIDLLKSSLEKYNSDFLHTTLADILLLNEKFSDAMTHYGLALEINPSNEAALSGMLRLENLAKGLDPNRTDDDAPDDEDDL